jgi:arsenical-resistance protein
VATGKRPPCSWPSTPFSRSSLSPCRYFYLKVLPGWLGLSTVGIHLSVWRIARTVLIFLGVPLVAGFLTRTIGERTRGRDWYETRLLPRLGPFALYGLLYTIVILFALQGHTVTGHPADVARIALPLLAYFAVMWFGSFFLGRAIGLPYERTATLAFTAAGNNFELAIAVAVGVFGVTSGEALAPSSRSLSSSPWCTWLSGPVSAGTRPRPDRLAKDSTSGGESFSSWGALMGCTCRSGRGLRRSRCS